MLNFIAIDLTSWLVDGPLLARGSANSATPLIGAAAELPRLLPPTTLHLGFLISLALVAAYGVWSRFAVERLPLPPRRAQPALQPCGRHRAAEGFPWRDDRLGRRRRARRRHPHARPRPSLRRRLLAGLWLSPAIAIALLARNSATGVVIASVLFGALSSAGANIQLFSNVPIEIVEILQGAVMIFAVAQFGVGWARRRAAS